FTEQRLDELVLGEAIKSVFDGLGEVDEFENIAEQFDTGLRLTVGDDVAAEAMVASMKHVDGLLEAAQDMAERLGVDPADPQMLAAAGEFVLESLYVHNRLTKTASATGSRYSR
ncbi:MAG: magnesium chelatase, partial [Planctomycetota bacterium]